MSLVSRIKSSICPAIICCGMAMFFVGMLPFSCRFIINSTHSLPQRYFVQLPWLTPGKGSITLFAWHERHLIKRIGGVAGDVVRYDPQGHLWVGNRCIGPVQRRESLEPLVPGTIPQGYVFVYTPHPDSLDSRYQHVGLIPVSQLQGRLFALGGWR